MKTVDLVNGMEVWVLLPYDGGSGWATVLDPHADPDSPLRPAKTVEIEFLPGEGPTYQRRRKVRPHDVIRARERAA